MDKMPKKKQPLPGTDVPLSRNSMRHAVTQPDEAELLPDYEIECCNCGEIPTVTIFQNGLIQSQTELCGPCCFGTADAFNPENW